LSYDLLRLSPYSPICFAQTNFININQRIEYVKSILRILIPAAPSFSPPRGSKSRRIALPPAYIRLEKPASQVSLVWFAAQQQSSSQLLYGPFFLSRRRQSIIYEVFCEQRTLQFWRVHFCLEFFFFIETHIINLHRKPSSSEKVLSCLDFFFKIDRTTHPHFILLYCDFETIIQGQQQRKPSFLLRKHSWWVRVFCGGMHLNLTNICVLNRAAFLLVFIRGPAFAFGARAEI
jgi:hypothetical protein